MIEFHLQESPQDWPRALQYLPNGGIIKLVDGVQRAQEVKQHNSALNVWIRHYVDNQNLADVALEQMKPIAREFFNSFVDGSFMQIAQYVNYVSEWNEYFANSQDTQERNKWIRWATACAIVWSSEFRTQSQLAHIRLILAETAVGNDIPPEVAQVSIDYDCLLGYHGYMPIWYGQINPDDWQFYSGRWASMDTHYESLGMDTSRINWVLGEYGAVGLRTAPSVFNKSKRKYRFGRAEGYHPKWQENMSIEPNARLTWPNDLDPQAGWNDAHVLGGNIHQYNQAHAYFIDHAALWNEQNNGRFLGATIFTSGGGSQWEGFELAQPDMDITAQFVGVYAPSPPDPPDPPEPPSEGIANASFEDGWTNMPPIGPLINQQPNNWQLTVLEEGQPIWAINRATGQPSIVNGTPECVHKICGQTLPVNECDELIRDGQTVYKVQCSKVSGVQLEQPIVLEPNTQYRLQVPIQVHYQNDYYQPPRTEPPEPDDIEFHVLLNDSIVSELWLIDLPDREWRVAQIVFTATGEMNFKIRFMTKWANRRDFFIDDLSLERIETQPNYKIIANLLPQDSYLDEKWRVLTEVHENKETILQSADDAGRLVASGNDSSFVRVWWPNRWSGDIVQWLHDNYGVNVEVTNGN